MLSEKELYKLQMHRTDKAWVKYMKSKKEYEKNMDNQFKELMEPMQKTYASGPRDTDDGFGSIPAIGAALWLG